jgi:hypothetical protein
MAQIILAGMHLTRALDDRLDDVRGDLGSRP